MQNKDLLSNGRFEITDIIMEYMSKYNIETMCYLISKWIGNYKYQSHFLISCTMKLTSLERRDISCPVKFPLKIYI